MPNRAAGKKAIQVLASILGGELPIDRPGRRPDKSGQSVFDIGIAQISDYGPVLIVQDDAFVLGQAYGFVPIPVVGVQFCMANTGVQAECLAILSIAYKLSHSVVPGSLYAGWVPLLANGKLLHNSVWQIVVSEKGV